MWRQYSRPFNFASLFKIIIRIKTKSSKLFYLHKRREFLWIIHFYWFSQVFLWFSRDRENAWWCSTLHCGLIFLTPKNFDGSMCKPLFVFWYVYLGYRWMFYICEQFNSDWFFVESYKEHCLPHSKTMKNILIRMTLSLNVKQFSVILKVKWPFNLHLITIKKNNKW